MKKNEIFKKVSLLVSLIALLSIIISCNIDSLTYNVTYNANGATSGTVPSQQLKTYNQTLILQSNGGNLERTGYIFSGWNTKEDGSGTSYKEGDEYKTEAALTLYAQWSQNTYTITYDGNGSTSGNVPANQIKEFGTDITININSGTLVRTGYTFSGWNTNKEGTGDNYAVNATYSNNKSITLYAKWTAKTYNVTFDYNEGNINSETSKLISQTYDSTIKLPSTNPTRTGFNFKEWNTQKDGKGTSYKIGDKYSTDGDLTIYALWNSNVYTITYDANNATSGSAPSSQQKIHGTAITLSTNGNLVKTGYIFSGWNTNKEGTGDNYDANATYTVDKNVTLFAKWTAKTFTATFNYNGITVSGCTFEGINQTYDSIITLPTRTLTRDGYDFIGWATTDTATKDDVTGKTYKELKDTTYYAIWSKAIYTITYDGNDKTGGTVPETQQKIHGTDITLQTNSGNLERTGFTFTGWNTNKEGTGSTYKEGATYSYNKNLTLYAKWYDNTIYKITYKANGAIGGTVPSTQDKKFDEIITIFGNTGKLTREGYSFAGWNTAEDGKDLNYLPGDRYKTNKDLTLYAQWISNDFTLTYDSNNATGGTVPNSVTIKYGESFTISTNSGTLVKTGYTFEGWNTKADGTGTTYLASTSLKPSSNLTLYAKWKIITYQITYDGNTSITGTAPSSQTKEYGTDITLQTNSGSLAKTGYTFAGWNTKADGTGTSYAAGAKYTSNAALALFAKWTANTYNATFDYNGGSLNSLTTVSVTQTYDSTIKLPANNPEKTGYTFKGWQYSNGTECKSSDKYTATSDITLKAQWEAIKYTLTFDYNGGSNNSAASESVTIAYDSTISLPANSPIRTGYSLKGWQYLSGTAFKAGDKYTTAGNMTIKAQWEAKKHTATFDYNGATVNGKTFETKEQTYDATIEIPTTKPSKTGYVFKGWATTSSATSDNVTDKTYQIDSTITYYAVWEKETYSITYDANGATSGTAPQSQTKEYGTNITLQDNSGKLVRTGYTFVGWNDNKDGSGYNYSVGAFYTANQSITLFAKWTANKYDVYFVKNDGSSSEESITQTYDSTIILPTTDPTKTGYTFTGWNTKSDGSGTSYKSGDTFKETVSSLGEGQPIALFAQWKANQYILTWDYGGGSYNGAILQNVVIPYNFNIYISSNVPERAGYSLQGWKYSDGTNYKLGDKYTATSNITLTAVWKANTYTVTFDYNGGSLNGITSENVSLTYNSLIAIPPTKPIKTGYDFNGWAKTANATSDNVTNQIYNIVGTTTYYAVWKIKTFTITYDGNTFTTGTAPSSQTKEYGTDITLQTNSGSLVKTGYTFSGWNTKADGTGTSYAAGAKYTSNEELSLFAKWTANNYNATFDYNGGSLNSLTTESVTQTYDSTIKLPANNPEKTGYTFEGWATSSSATSDDVSNKTYNILSGTTYYALWTAETNDVYFVKNPGISLPPEKINQTFGTTIKLPEPDPTQPGYTFVGWNTQYDGNGTSYKSGDTFKETLGHEERIILYGIWTANKYTATFDYNGATVNGKTFETKEQTYDATIEVPTTKPSKTGYVFKGWATTSSATSDNVTDKTYQIDSTITYYAVWEKETYSVTYDANGATSGTAPQSQTKESGNYLILQDNSGSLAKTGYTFVGWNDNKDGSGYNYSVGAFYTANQSITLYAKWTANIYEINFNFNEGGVNIGSYLDQTYDQPLGNPSRVPSEEGYDLVAWNNKSDGSGDITYKIGDIYTTASKLTLYPVWKIKTFTITYNANGANSGTVPANQSKEYGTSIKIQSNSGNLQKDFYSFYNWNTKADGTGTNYNVGSNYNVDAELTLYAQWRI